MMTNTVESTRTERLADVQSLDREELIEAIAQGLPAELARELAAKLDLSQDELAGLLRLTPRTLQRRLEAGRLELGESERLWELARLFFRAVEVLESEAAATQWLKNPIQALGWKTPMAFAQSAVGLREVENVLGRIE